MNTRYAVAVFAILLGNVALGMKLASAKEDAESCEDGLMCYAKIDLTHNASKPPVLSAGFEISSKAPGSQVGEKTTNRIKKNSPFTYKKLAHGLMEKVESALKQYNCSMRGDLVAHALRKSAFAVRDDCKKTGTKECMKAMDVLECGKEISVPPIAYPWEVMSASDKKQDFDKDDSNFDIFYNLLGYTKLDEMLGESSNITLLAPNDEAFAKSAAYLTSYKGEMDDEKMIYEAYKTAFMKGMKIGDVQVEGVDLLRFLLAYHVLGGKHPEKTFRGVPKYRLTSATVPVLSVMSEIIDLSADTPNAKILDGDVNIVGDVLVHCLDHVMLPYEMEFEMSKLMKCPAKETTKGAQTGVVGVAGMPQSVPQAIDGMPSATKPPTQKAEPAQKTEAPKLQVLEITAQGMVTENPRPDANKTDAAKPPIIIFTPAKNETESTEASTQPTEEMNTPMPTAEGQTIKPEPTAGPNPR